MADDAVAYVAVGGVEYLCREHTYTASVLRLSDTFSVTIPAPGGHVYGADGGKTKMLDAIHIGDEVTFSLSDPNVRAGQKVKKLTGRVTGRRATTDKGGGTVLAVSGADLGWHLSSCGRVLLNLRGLTWGKFAEKVLGLTLNPATGAVVSDANGWGFKGFADGNTINRSIRLGRAVAESDFQRASAPQTSLMVPRFQVEVGQTLDALLVQYARINGYLVNVSTDGWIQLFRPAWDGKTYASPAGAANLEPVAYSSAPLYVFNHYPADDSRSSQNNTMGATLDENGDGYYTHVECWNTVIDTLNNDPVNPNAGRYHGTYDPPASRRPFTFERRYTFTDPEQYGSGADGTPKVASRAKWQWERLAFDGWTYSFETVGHSQNGVPFVEDTMAELHDMVYGVEGVFYVASVEPTRRLARPGFDKNAGTRCKITLKKPLLAA